MMNFLVILLRCLPALFLAVSVKAAVSPFDITRNMSPGWNLGNSLDAFGGETNWGNPKTDQEMIDIVRAAGFRTLRVPVTWDEFTSNNDGTIDTSRMELVAKVIQYGLRNNMYVILNIHHNDGWEAPTYANEVKAKVRLTSLWRQISLRFRAYDTKRLIFEVMNEPRNGDDWWGTQEYYEVTNRLNAAALDTIRATGGGNKQRLILLPTYVAAPYDPQLDAFVKPKDPMVALSVHAYIPYDLALQVPGESNFTDTKSIDELFVRLNEKLQSKGTPVVVGEWGTTNKGNHRERIRHAEYFARSASKYGIPIVVWDNGVLSDGAESFGLLDRVAKTWRYPELVTAIMRGISASR